MATLVETGLFVDLYPGRAQCGTGGNRVLRTQRPRKVTGYQRGHEIDQGSAAVVEYEQYMVDHEPARLDRIAAYNEDDVRSTLALRDWLVALRPADLAWRASVLEPEEGIPSWMPRWRPCTPSARARPSTSSVTCSATGYGSDGPTRHRSWPRPPSTPQSCSMIPEVLAGLTYLGQVERIGKKGKPLKGTERSSDGQSSRSVPASVPDGPGSSTARRIGATGYADVDHIDTEQREVVLKWNERCSGDGRHPLSGRH